MHPDGNFTHVIPRFYNKAYLPNNNSLYKYKQKDHREDNFPSHYQNLLGGFKYYNELESHDKKSVYPAEYCFIANEENVEMIKNLVKYDFKHSIKDLRADNSKRSMNPSEYEFMSGIISKNEKIKKHVDNLKISIHPTDEGFKHLDSYEIDEKNNAMDSREHGYILLEIQYKYIN